MQKHKILILTYYWPPAGGAGVQRWLKFVKYLSQMNYDIHIYTPENPEAPAIDNSLLDDIPTNITVIKKPIWEPFTFYKKLTRKKGKFNAGFLSEVPNNKKSITEKISLFIRANFFIPDAKMFWINPSVRFLSKYLKENKIETIISSGPPHSLHLIANKLKKKLKLKWVADFRDPWTNIDFYKDLPTIKMIDNYQKFLEKEVLINSDRLIIVGEQWKKDFLKIYNREITVITNGFDIDFPEDIKLNDKFTILHMGSINSDRTHESFFIALSNLYRKYPNFKSKLQLEYVGKTDVKTRDFVKKYGLENETIFTPYVEHNKIASILKSSHALYLPINNTENANGILTGKYFEYLAAKRPIIAQGPIASEISDSIKYTQSGKIIDYEDYKGMEQTILYYFEKYLSNDNSLNSININQYSRKNLTKQLDQLLSTLNQ